MAEPTGGLQVDPQLREFVEADLLAGLDLSPEQFWTALAGLQERFAPRIAELLARRDELQQQIDTWHEANGAGSREAYEAFLTEIGYLLPDDTSTTISVENVDPEIAEVPGPQLVVPSTVPRYALNAANARWGSLYDAFYGTDALPLDHELAKGYDEKRGAQVIAAADELLDELFPLAQGSHADVAAYRASADGLTVEPGGARLADPSQFAGFRELDADGKGAVLLQRNGLHAELTIDPGHRVGRQHHADVADVVLESAVTTIVDLEDSVATVDGEDKALAYRTWLGLMTGELVSEFQKGGETVTRRVNGDREYIGADGGELTLPGRSLLLARTVGHHMTTNAVRTAGGTEVAEGVLDALVVAAAAQYDLSGKGAWSNSRTGSVYVVKPKQHGPDEVRLTVELFAAVEEALGLPAKTLKIGIMDEEKRTSVNLGASIAEAAERVIFVNTGFLDRTGDEIHTCFVAGPVVPKGEMKTSTWLTAYEDRNVDVALRAGFSHKAQIGKGMWAKPAAMAEMLEQKGAQPKQGANCAWVPSPTAATLHALHYLRTDVHAVQEELAERPLRDRRDLLVLPLQEEPVTDEVKTHELETNAQSILGYVVRWVGLGIGCSTVPDLEGVGLMEDRATLRISSQLLANWLHHGLVDEQTVRDTFARMAALVDEQNANEPGYPPMSKDLDGSESFQAALELVFTGRTEPNGYTERVLTSWRQKAKA
ncbi:MAG: malate synthase [Pseudonocardia sp.]|jgi:malate synthase|uniref:malate synthase G n=1 Tax=Pseudonocardia sp. TaxID=60912 RepID=UPI002632F6F0|nr:malate synthase G [Pseudonocardia sp.]MCU1627837.1 malate synthase [Pseudonocardia sp.]MDT7698706.1 malate synthase [Pseudonocardiales bacterium]